MSNQSNNHLIRAQILLGEEAMARLRNSKIALFGLGGVGGYCAEALARSGVGRMDLIDRDEYSLSNLNRQLHATRSTVGRLKVDVVKERIADIDPEIEVNTFPMFYLPETADAIDLSQYDYVIDCIDTVKAKLHIITACHGLGVPVISCMGTGNKLHPEWFQVADISKTSICPLARVMRKELKNRGIKHLKVVYSQEEALTPAPVPGEVPDEGRRSIPGSVAFVPGAAGLLLAGQVVRDLVHTQNK